MSDSHPLSSSTFFLSVHISHVLLRPFFPLWSSPLIFQFSACYLSCLHRHSFYFSQPCSRPPPTGQTVSNLWLSHPNSHRGRLRTDASSSPDSLSRLPTREPTTCETCGEAAPAQIGEAMCARATRARPTVLRAPTLHHTFSYPLYPTLHFAGKRPPYLLEERLHMFEDQARSQLW